MKQRRNQSHSRGDGFDARGVVTFGAALVVGLTVAGTLGGLHWSLELATHFLPQLALACLPLLAGCAWHRAPRWGLALTGALVLAGVQVIDPLTDVQTEAALGPGVRVFYANVQRGNARTDDIARQLVQADADVVFLVEVDERWLESLRPELAEYPFELEHPLDSNFGLALYSRLPVSSADLFVLGPQLKFDAPAVVATVASAGSEFQFIGVHTVPPVSASLAAHRDEQLADIGARIGSPTRHTVVVGDLNTTVFAAGLRRLLDTSGLRSAVLEPGSGGTWPAFFPSPLRVRIDHVLITSGVQVRALEVGGWSGSDHRPLLVELTVPSARP